MNNYNKEQIQNNDYSNNYINEENFEKQNMNSNFQYNNEKHNEDFKDNDKSMFANTDFKKNDESEKELKKLITGRGFNKMGETINNIDENMNYNFNSDDFKSVDTTKNSIKVPGRIFSSKKKI